MNEQKYSAVLVSFYGKVSCWVEKIGLVHPVALLTESKQKILANSDSRTKFYLGVMPMSKEDFADLVYYKPSENSQMPCVYRPPMGLPFYWKHCEDRELTMHQALAMCGYSPDDQPRLERDICRQFGLRNVSDGDLEEMQTWVLSAWPLEELEYSLKSTYDSIGDTLRDVQRLYLQVGRQRNLLAGQFK